MAPKAALGRLAALIQQTAVGVRKSGDADARRRNGGADTLDDVASRKTDGGLVRRIGASGGGNQL